MGAAEFSFRSRQRALECFKSETFDLLFIGGGITAAGAARDAASRGLKVALIERRDFAYGTSSRSSKLIHGGLRYLENMEFHLVFEALAERSFLLRAVPHMVRPLPFYLPVYETDAHGRGILGLGLWLYDLLALFRTPGFHKSLSRKKFLREIPFLKADGLKGGFRYFDASMWDDVLAVETLRSASQWGAQVANYVEARSAIWENGRVVGFHARDLEAPEGQGDFEIRATQVVVCAGPWTDQVGGLVSPDWKKWLNPSKGVHLIFDARKIPVPGAVVMSHPDDGRISFVIPRPDFGNGVVIVGTTDGPSPLDPERVEIEPSDVQYLMGLLSRYFPTLKLSTSDILSGYVGVRPLMAGPSGGSGGDQALALQKVSREHYIGPGPGGTLFVAGGKYTTHRKMAQEIVDLALENWKREAKSGRAKAPPERVARSRTHVPLNVAALPPATQAARAGLRSQGVKLPETLWDRYGAEAKIIYELSQSHSEGQAKDSAKDPDGFPHLAAQLRHAIRTGMVMHLEDFYLRRVPLYSTRADHGLPWAAELAQVWAEEKGLGEAEARAELVRLQSELGRRSAWMASVQSLQLPPASTAKSPQLG